jgi:hypothetical protein
MVISLTEDECDHLYVLFHGTHGLRVCGCGAPDDAWKLVLDLLEATAGCYDSGGRFEGWVYEGQHPYDRLCGSSGAAHIICGALEETGLLQHGGSFYGSWITDDGRLYLDMMRRHDYDDLDIGNNVGFPHDGKGCPDGCAYSLPWMRAG